jgi:hypothetical protein
MLTRVKQHPRVAAYYLSSCLDANQRKCQETI